VNARIVNFEYFPVHVCAGTYRVEPSIICHSMCEPSIICHSVYQDRYSAHYTQKAMSHAFNKRAFVRRADGKLPCFILCASCFINIQRCFRDARIGSRKRSGKWEKERAMRCMAHDGHGSNHTYHRVLEANIKLMCFMYVCSYRVRSHISHM
jgi:hypothetical protein